MQVLPGRSLDRRNTPNPLNLQLRNLITEIGNGTCPQHFLHLLLNSRSGANNPLSTRPKLSPLQRLYFSIMAIQDHTTQHEAKTMIRLQQSTKCCWFGSNEANLVVTGQIVSSNKDDGFSLVTGLFSDSGDLLNIKVDREFIIIDMPNDSKAVLDANGKIYNDYSIIDGKLYKGDLVNGKRHGKGKMIAPDGTTYTGEWADDQPINGTMTYSNGDKFTGSFSNGERKSGTITCSDGSKFSGNFSKGIPKDGTLTIGGKTLNARLPRTEDYFITEVVTYSIRESNSSFIKWYVERFIPGNIYPESTLNEIVEYYAYLETISMQILALPHQPDVEDIISRSMLSPYTQVVVIKTQGSSDHLEIYSLQYFLNVMTKYIKDLILTGHTSTSYSITPLSRTKVVENLLSPDKVKIYANSFKEKKYNYIADAEQLPAPKLTLEIEPHTDGTT